MEQRYRILFENAKDGIYMTSKDGLLIDFNHAVMDLLNYTREELLSLTVSDLLAYPAQRPKLISEIEKHGYKKHYEVIFAKKDKSQVLCLLTSSVWKDDDGSILGYQGIVHDVTEQKNMESRFNQIQKLEAIGTLAGGIAHDFNNLLMTIQGNASIMLLNIDSTHKMYERLKKIEQAVKNGARLTSNLLRYARKTEYEIKPVDLNQIIQNTLDTFGRTNKHIKIHKNFCATLPIVDADAAQIEQVLLNLFINAFDALPPENGNIYVITKKITRENIYKELQITTPHEYIKLTIRDTGHGIDATIIDRIFDPFFTTKAIGRGTGFGLASAYSIIQSHKGQITVDSQPGHGATFSIYFPVSLQKIKKKKNFHKKIKRGTGTLLLVDDEYEVLEVTKRMLEALGYTLLTANNGEKAIEIYKENHSSVDAVILDLIMPNMGGHEVKYKLKGINSDVKILLVTGSDIHENDLRIPQDYVDFIDKPFNMQKLAEKIKKVLNN